MKADKTKLICITGLPGAGKSTVSDFLVENGYQFLRFGQITLDIVKERGLTPNEENERRIREQIRKEHGMAAFAILSYPQIKKLLKNGNVVGDGLYSFEEYKYLKSKLKNRLVVIAVYAPPPLRYERISKRKLLKTDKNLRHRPFTKKETQLRDFAELENLNKGATIAMADYTLVNTKTKKYLIKHLKEVIDQF